MYEFNVLSNSKNKRNNVNREGKTTFENLQDEIKIVKEILSLDRIVKEINEKHKNPEKFPKFSEELDAVANMAWELYCCVEMPKSDLSPKKFIWAYGPRGDNDELIEKLNEYNESVNKYKLSEEFSLLERETILNKDRYFNMSKKMSYFFSDKTSDKHPGSGNNNPLPTLPKDVCKIIQGFSKYDSKDIVEEAVIPRSEAQSATTRTI